MADESSETEQIDQLMRDGMPLNYAELTVRLELNEPGIQTGEKAQRLLQALKESIAEACAIQAMLQDLLEQWLEELEIPKTAAAWSVPTDIPDVDTYHLIITGANGYKSKQPISKELADQIRGRSPWLKCSPDCGSHSGYSCDCRS